MKNIFITALALMSMTVLQGEAKSFKRGFGENTLYYVEDLQALLPGTSWYYNWGNEPAVQVADYVGSEKGMEFIPQAWSSYDENKLRTYYKAHPNDKYLLGFNEPNFPDQANMLPSEAAEKWHSLEALADELGLILVGPAMNYAGSPLKDGKVWNPFDWMDAFIAAYKEKYGTEPRYDYTAVHAYMDNATSMMDFVDKFAEKYGKKVWLTEFCAWESESITAETQQKLMIAKVKALETSDNVYRYAWFKARNANKYPYYNLLYYPTKTISKGTLTDLGFAYVHMSEFNMDKYYGVGEAIPSNGFVDCNLSCIRKSADPRALDDTELFLNENSLSATYQIDVPEDGDYKLVIRYSRDGSDDLTARIHILDGDGNYLVKRQAVDATEGWTNYVAKAFDVTLKAGKQTITVKKASYASMALSLVKLVKEVDADDDDMKTMTGEDIDNPDSGDDTGGSSTVTPGENQSFDEEVVVSDDSFKFDDNYKYYSIFLDATTQKANISDDRFVNIGDNGTSQNSYIWESTFNYGDATGKNSFGVEGEYKALVTSDKGWSGMGYNIDASLGNLDLSCINKDYKLHMAVKASNNYPVDFYITDGSGHQAHLILGQYDMSGKDPVANFKRDGKWHNVDIPVSYLTQKFGIDFSHDTDYNGNILCINAGNKQGVEIDFDAVFFYGPKDSQPDNNEESGLSRFKANISDEAFTFSNDERYYIISLDATTKAQNLSESQIVDCGPNDTTHNLYPWENSVTFNSTTDNNSFGVTEPYMSASQTDKGWMGLGYNIAGSTSPLNLSGISDDYYFHFAIKSTYTGSVMLYVTDATGTNGYIVLGKNAYDGHAPLGDFTRDGKWHHVDVPVHLLNQNDGVNFTRSTNFTGNIFCIVMAGQQGSTVDYDAVFFHGPKDSPAYADETVADKTITIKKAADVPFSFSENETYYIISLDSDTKKTNLTDDQIIDIGPDEQTRFLYPWSNTVVDQSAMGENSFGVEGGFTSWETASGTTWSGLGFYIDRPGLTDLSGIGKDYSLHFAVKSTTTQSIDFIFTDGNNKEYHLVLGQENYGNNKPVGDFERDNTWYNVEVPMAYLIKQGLDFRTAKAYGGNIFSVMLGTAGGLKFDYDAVFFHGPKNKATGIEDAVMIDMNGSKPNIYEGIYDMQGRKLQEMTTPGIYIIRSAQGVKKVLMK
jgi:hypothetical protein